MSQDPRKPPPLPRQPSKPEIQAAEVDRTVGGAANQRRFDLPKRAPTLTGLPAPPAPGSVPPPAPNLPTEFAPTKRPAMPWGKTVRAPSPPPDVLAAARRADADTLPAAQGPASGSSLPPVSADLYEARDLVRRRAIGQKDAEFEQERRLRQKLELELEIERERAKRTVPPPKPWIDERLVKALVALLGAMTALGTPLGIWLTAKATATESAQERQAEVTKEATATASSAKAESRDASKELDDLRKQLAAERAYNREVLRRLGVIVPKREGDPDAPKLDVEVPLRKPGTVTPGAVLVVKTLPP